MNPKLPVDPSTLFFTCLVTTILFSIPVTCPVQFWINNISSPCCSLRNKGNISDSDRRIYSIYDVLGTALSALHILTQKYTYFFHGIYPHNFNLINSGLLVKDHFDAQSCIYFLHSVWQVSSFPWVFIHLLSNSKNNYSGIELGSRFHAKN